MDANENPILRGLFNNVAYKIGNFLEKKQEEARESGEPTLLSCIADCADESVRQDEEAASLYNESNNTSTKEQRLFEEFKAFKLQQQYAAVQNRPQEMEPMYIDYKVISSQ